MTNAQLNVILATILDKAGDDRVAANRIMKRYALAQALAVEEQLSDEDTIIVAAAATLYECNDTAVNPVDSEGDAFKPIVITDYVKELLEESYVPVFEAAAIGSLVAMQKHGSAIENDLHRLLQDVDLLVALDEENADAATAAAAADRLTHASAKRRLALHFGCDA